MKAIAIILAIAISGCASTKVTDAGAHVRVVNNVDFVLECRFVEAISMNVAVWTPALASAGIKSELRNQAAEIGGNVIVYTSGSADAWSAHGAADVYYCDRS